MLVQWSGGAASRLGLIVTRYLSFNSNKLSKLTIIHIKINAYYE